jgi:methionine-rich copper-binding protein CopC
MNRAAHIVRSWAPGTLTFLLVLLVMTGIALGHAFPDHADPKVGATVAAAPGRVRIWFDSVLEPVFSTIKVQDASGKVVDNQDGRVNPSDATLLEVTVPRLASGRYHVIWSVVARDGHRTTGDYTFTVK